MAKVPTTGPGGITHPGERSILHGPSRQGTRQTNSTPFPLAKPRPARSTALSPERCAAVLGTLYEISIASAGVDGCGKLLECISDELQAEQAALILCNPLTRELEFVVHN
jgi:hypothetical protein